MQKANLSDLVRIEGTDNSVNLAPAELLAEVTIPVEGAGRRFLERAIEDSVQLIRNGAESGMEIAYVAEDMLFELIGLRIGDTIQSPRI